MLEIKIPRSGDAISVNNSFASKAENLQGCVWNIDLSNTFFSPSGLVVLYQWLAKRILFSAQCRLVGPENILSYLSRMDVLEAVDLQYSNGLNRKPNQGRFIPLQLISDYNEVFYATDNICDFIIRHFRNGREFLPALEWSVNEVVDNVITHSGGEGVLCAQYYPTKSQLKISIADNGRGILSSLSEGYQLKDDAAALDLAVRPGVTRNNQIGQGNGLAGSLEIVMLNGGIFNLISGSGFLFFDGSLGINTTKYEYQGSLVTLVFNENRPVNLNNTEIVGHPSFNYLNRECERIVNKGGIRVKEECSWVGGRQPARLLRNKVISLLPELDPNKKITLDFNGISMPSSSFMDELIGKLYLELGSNFDKTVEVTGLTDTMRKIANRVIYQRINY